jgi:hypothetical protein
MRGRISGFYRQFDYLHMIYDLDGNSLHNYFTKLFAYTKRTFLSFEKCLVRRICVFISFVTEMTEESADDPHTLGVIVYAKYAIVVNVLVTINFIRVNVNQ